MQLEIITPESKLFTGEITSVQMPGADGLFQVLNDHAPIISTLVNGSVKVELKEALKSTKKLSQRLQVEPSMKSFKVDIKGGVVEVLNNKLILLAE